MPLTNGSRPSPYEITAAIGAGRMGEVYRARDSKLGRDVAIKSYPRPSSCDFSGGLSIEETAVDGNFAGEREKREWATAGVAEEGNP